MSTEKQMVYIDTVLDEFLKRYTERERNSKLVFAACEIKQDFADMMCEITTVDAVEVKHAHLVERIVDHEVPSYTVFECSACFSRCEQWNRYCSYCGARLDGETEFVRTTTTSGLSLVD